MMPWKVVAGSYKGGRIHIPENDLRTLENDVHNYMRMSKTMFNQYKHNPESDFYEQTMNSSVKEIGRAHV